MRNPFEPDLDKLNQDSMADYHPLIARAVAGLEKNTGENRRALYERARTALVAQLRGVVPALDESEITRERLSLEEAIRKVEAEAGKRARPEAAEEPSRALRTEACAASGDGGRGRGPRRRGRRRHRSAHRGLRGDARRASAATAGTEQRPTTCFEPPRAELESQQLHGAPTADEQVPPSYAGAPPPQVMSKTTRSARPPRTFGRVIRFFVLMLVLGGLAGGAYSQREAIMSMVASFRSAPPPKPRETAAPATKPKIPDRVGTASGTSAPANAPAAAVAQKVVLYDEDPSDPKGKRYVGSALWRTETVSPGPGLAPELVVRADIEIPERHLRMTWSLRRNTDKSLPASHTIEIVFTLPADFAEGGIGNVPGVLMKQDEQTRGVPLAGLAVKVTNGYFLIGLSAVDVDVARNIQLFKERDWFDIPVVYTSNKRAILAMEKGTPGVRAFDEAFRAWGQ